MRDKKRPQNLLVNRGLFIYQIGFKDISHGRPHLPGVRKKQEAK
jgi:hypothetical protein